MPPLRSTPKYASILLAYETGKEDAMPQVLVRDLDAAVVERLKQRARLHGRSLQKEAKAILEAAAITMTMDEARQVADGWQQHFGDRQFDDSAELIREDRER